MALQEFQEAKLSFNAQMGKLHAALNPQGVAQEVWDEHRQAIMRALQATPSTLGTRLYDGVLTDRNELEKFVRAKHGDTEDSVGKFLESFQPKLEKTHPLKKLRVTYATYDSKLDRAPARQKPETRALPPFVAKIEEALIKLYGTELAAVRNNYVLPTTIALVLSEIPSVKRNLRDRYGVDPKQIHDLLRRADESAHAGLTDDMIEHRDEANLQESPEGGRIIPWNDLERIDLPEVHIVQSTEAGAGNSKDAQLRRLRDQSYVRQWKEDIRRETAGRIAMHDFTAVTPTESLIEILGETPPLQHVLKVMLESQRELIEKEMARRERLAQREAMREAAAELGGEQPAEGEVTGSVDESERTNTQSDAQGAGGHSGVGPSERPKKKAKPKKGRNDGGDGPAAVGV
jgi:hypothetical protein